MTGVQTCALPICFPVTIFVVDFGFDLRQALLRGGIAFGKLAAHIVHVGGTGAAGQGGDGGKAIQGGGLEGHGGESRSSGIKAEV